MAFSRVLWLAASSILLLLTSSYAAAQTRDPFLWPFANTSIWNMPIGSNAVYVPANLPPIPSSSDPNNPDYWWPVPWVDWDIIVLTPSAPVTDIYHSSAAWSGANRCDPTDVPPIVYFQLPMPSNFIVPDGPGNNSAAFLEPDGRTLIQTQPFTRCYSTLGGTTLSPWSQIPPVDLYGSGIDGSHGGSGLSAIGGSIRIGELRPGQQGPHHALKLSFYSAQVLHKCGANDPPNYQSCYRWPARGADANAGSANGGYGTVAGGNPPPAMQMGALLAIPASVDLSTLGLETEPGTQLAWTLQNYGAYIDDSGGEPQFEIGAESGPAADGSYTSLDAQFTADWGYDIEQRVGTNTPWSRDIQRLMAALNVVDNNGPTSIGGGGTPLQPLAPPLSVTRFEENDEPPPVSFSPSGAWVRRGAEVAAFSGGYALTYDISGATATFPFSGTAVSWIGLKCNVCGIANVSVDGGAVTPVDTAGPAAPGSPGLASEVVYTASGLPAGGHTLQITVTGTTTSGGAHVAVDAFDVSP